jgi:hypothetical protein
VRLLWHRSHLVPREQDPPERRFLHNPRERVNQMAPAKATSPKGPEKKFGPFPAGIGVAIWINTVETDSGPRKIRSITLNPRRYFDREAEEWRDSGSYHPGDIPALIFALTKAQEYVFTTPLPGEEPGTDRRNDPAY